MATQTLSNGRVITRVVVSKSKSNPFTNLGETLPTDVPMDLINGYTAAELQGGSTNLVVTDATHLSASSDMDTLFLPTILDKSDDQWFEITIDAITEPGMVLGLGLMSAPGYNLTPVLSMNNGTDYIDSGVQMALWNGAYFANGTPQFTGSQLNTRTYKPSVNAGAPYQLPSTAEANSMQAGDVYKFIYNSTADTIQMLRNGINLIPATDIGANVVDPKFIPFILLSGMDITFNPGTLTKRTPGPVIT